MSRYTIGSTGGKIVGDFTSSVPSNGNVVSSNCTCALTNIFPLSGG